MSLKEKYAQVMAEEMAKEIDAEIITQLLIEVMVDKGWTKTKIFPGLPVGTALTDWFTETAMWCHQNAVGDYKLLQGQWLFELESDAVLFILRWS